MASFIQNIGNTTEYKKFMEKQQQIVKEMKEIKEQLHKCEMEKQQWRAAYENELKKNKELTINLGKTEDMLVTEICNI